MRVFVTGATGFIGTALVQDLLAAGHEVTGLVRSAAAEQKLQAIGARAHRGTVEDLDGLRRGAAAADGVIHTAFFHALSHISLPTRLRVLMGGLPGGIMHRFVAASVGADRVAIETLATAMKGNDRALVAAFPTMALKPGRLATEDDAPDPDTAGGPRGATEVVVKNLGASGLRASVVRLPPLVHGPGDRAGLLPRLHAIARRKGASAYVDEGENRWGTVHVRDAAALFRRALEAGVAGAAYHAVAEEGLPFKAVAQAIGRLAGVRVASKSQSEAGTAFGFLSPFVPVDNPVSSSLTQERLGWQPREPDLMTELDTTSYFAR